MAHLGDGVLWDILSPVDTELRSVGALEIRDLRIGLGIRIDKEHVALATASAGGEHKAGSAVVYTDPTVTFPTNKPDGSTLLNSADEGRLALIAGKFFVYTGDDSRLWGSDSSGSFTVDGANTWIDWIIVGYAFRIIVISSSSGINGVILFNGISNQSARFINMTNSNGSGLRLEFQAEQDSANPDDPYRFRVRSNDINGGMNYEVIR